MKKFLLIIILLLLVSCKQEISQENCIIYNDIPIYTVVRGDTSSKAVELAAVHLRKQIEEITGVKMPIKTDWHKDNVRDEFEILVGPTNRPESKDLYEKLNAGVLMDYMIDKSGNHYVIAGDDSYIMEAVEVFISNMKLLKGGILKMDENMRLERAHLFPVYKMTVNDIDIGEYAIVYPAYYSKNQILRSINLQTYIYTATGKKLDVISDAEPERPHEIIIGKSRGNTYDQFGNMDCVIEIGAKHIKLGSNNYWFDVKAIDLFMEEFLGYTRTGTAINLKTSDSKSYLSKNTLDIILCAWCTSGDPFTTENQIREVAECGMNLINLAVPNDEIMLNNLLHWCAKYDLRVLWTDYSLYFNYTAEDLNKTYFDSPVTWGIYVKDEPNSSEFEKLKDLTQIFNDTLNKGEKYFEPFINLFPLYANEQQLGNPTYLEHVVQYLETVNPKLCSVDIYPLYTSSVYADYMRNIDIVATESRKRGMDLSIYIQSVSFAASIRTPNFKELKWQTYCCLSFGAKSIMYFTYITPYSSAEDFKNALIDHDLKKTDRWFYAQELNAEINAMASVYAQYKNLGAFNFNYSEDYRYLDFDNQYKDFDLIEVIECKNPLLFGCFEKDDGNLAFTVVNMTNLQRSNGASDVRMKLSSAKNVTAYVNGIPKKLNQDSNGYISLTLDVGEGVFITCE